MSAPCSITRRSVVAALGAGGFGLGTVSKLLAAPPAFDHGMAGGPAEPSGAHPLIGHWLVMVNMPSNPGAVVAVPGIFSADGSAMLMFPPVGILGDGVQFRGAVIGCWDQTGARHGHVTAVQVLADANGAYRGSLTVDSYLSVSDDGLVFTEDGEVGTVTVRNHFNEVVAIRNSFADTSLAAHRMTPGQPGFPEGRKPLDPRTP